MYELKKELERYLRVNLLGPGPRLMKKEFTGSRSHKGWETLLYMFRAMFSPIIKSTWLYLQYLVVFIEVAASWFSEWVETVSTHSGHKPAATLDEHYQIL